VIAGSVARVLGRVLARVLARMLAVKSEHPDSDPSMFGRSAACPIEYGWRQQN
jgi:hypothetical protein